MNNIDKEIVEAGIKQGLEKIVSTEDCTLEKAYQIGFEDALKLIKDIFGLK